MAKIYSQLEKAQLENRTSDPSAGTTGLVYINTTTGKPMLDDGTTVRPVLRNDDKLIIGTNATAANNVRVHHSGNAKLQFLAGNDLTSEGSTSSSLAEVGLRLETWTEATKPSPGNVGRTVYTSDSQNVLVDTGAVWKSVAGAAVPVGGIIAFVGGYFTSSSNGGFTSVLGNTVAAVNTLLNSSGWYACDGSALNLSGSPIYAGTGRYLPNLTDSRFLMGSTAAGAIGGQNSVTLLTANLPSHSHAIDHSHGTHTHAIDHDHAATATGAHTHGVYRDDGSSSPGNAFKWTSGSNSGTTNATVSTTPSINIAAYTGSSGASAAISFTGSSGTTGSATAYENRPVYLGVIFIQRAI